MMGGGVKKLDRAKILHAAFLDHFKNLIFFPIVFLLVHFPFKNLYFLALSGLRRLSVSISTLVRF